MEFKLDGPLKTKVCEEVYYWVEVYYQGEPWPYPYFEAHLGYIDGPSDSITIWGKEIKRGGWFDLGGVARENIAPGSSVGSPAYVHFPQPGRYVLGVGAGSNGNIAQYAEYVVEVGEVVKVEPTPPPPPPEEEVKEPKAAIISLNIPTSVVKNKEVDISVEIANIGNGPGPLSLGFACISRPGFGTARVMWPWGTWNAIPDYPNVWSIVPVSYSEPGQSFTVQTKMKFDYEGEYIIRVSVGHQRNGSWVEDDYREVG